MWEASRVVKSTAAAAASLVSLAASPALAAAPGQGAPSSSSESDPTLAPVVAERRSGLVFGASGGIAFAGASGYPNNSTFIGDPKAYSESPLLVGWSSSWFLMGALTDYLSFGPMINVAEFDTARWRSTGIGVGFRGEVFPFVRLLPILADTSVYAQLGFGATELRAKGGSYPTADGAESFLGVGVHHEVRLTRLLGGHLALGPHLEYDAIYSIPAERHWLTAGLRVAWYGGTVALDRP